MVDGVDDRLAGAHPLRLDVGDALQRGHPRAGRVDDDVRGLDLGGQGGPVGRVGERHVRPGSVGDGRYPLGRRREGCIPALEHGDAGRAVERRLREGRRAGAPRADDDHARARDLEALLGDRAQQPRPVRVVADEPASGAFDGVDRAHELGRGRQGVEVVDDGGLARHSHVQPRVPQRAGARHRLADAVRLHVVAQVDVVEAELGEGGVVDGWGQGVPDRRAEEGEDPGPPGHGVRGHDRPPRRAPRFLRPPPACGPRASR